jgi:hypothetical protein
MNQTVFVRLQAEYDDMDDDPEPERPEPEFYLLDGVKIYLSGCPDEGEIE